jgi:hypothetical protein
MTELCNTNDGACGFEAGEVALQVLIDAHANGFVEVIEGKVEYQAGRIVSAEGELVLSITEAGLKDLDR